MPPLTRACGRFALIQATVTSGRAVASRWSSCTKSRFWTGPEVEGTLDELLDILAMKSGRDWGVDIPSKVIFFYPKGVKADAYNVW